MKKLLLLSLVLLYYSTGQAQFQNGLWTGKQANNWEIYNGAGINFNTSPPSALTTGQLYGLPFDDYQDLYSEATSSISDSNGNLLFYTNGVTVWDKNHAVMPNGEGLLGDATSTQGALIVAKPGSSNIYYIFTTRYAIHYDLNYEAYGSVRYSEVDITLNNGLGAVTENKNIVLLDENLDLIYSNEEKLTSVHHSDGVRVWVLARQDTSYNAFLITGAGVSTVPVVSNIGSGRGDASPGGQLKFSPDGTKLAVTNPLGFGIIGTEVFYFDNTLGEITSTILTIRNDAATDIDYEYGGIYSVEFSPNSRFIYLAGLNFSTLHQFDLSAGNEQAILETGLLLYQNLTLSPLFKSSQLQVASDGKIYMSSLNSPVLHVIDYPNNAGTAAGFDANGAFDLAGKVSGSGLPNMVQSYFESGILYDGKCAMQDVSFSTIRIPGIESIIWDFGDPASGAANASADLEPAHSYQNAGTYTVTAIITSNGAQQTATTTVTIAPAPVAVPPQGNALVQCTDADGNAVFNLTQYNSIILGSQDAGAFTVSYYASEADLLSNTPIANAANFTTTGQIVYAQVVNNATGCFTNTSFTLVVNPMPTASTPNDMEVCANTTGEAIFNLTNQDAAILGNQDPALYRVTYYANEQDVQDNNPIAAPEAFASSGQMVFALVSAIAGSNCTPATTRFNITALPAPSIIDVIEYTGCSPFNLIAITAQEGEGLDLTFYNNEDDAIAGSNAIATTESYNVQGNAATLYVAAKNAQGCTDVSEIQLAEGGCNIPRGISPNNDGYNDSLDLSGFNVAQLSIFNRYGAKVFSRSNYIDQWHGQTDNNNELPTGTYYYSIQTNTGEQKTGWVYVNREVN